nr:MAG: RNA helicase [Sanya dicistro-like virus 3]
MQHNQGNNKSSNLRVAGSQESVANTKTSNAGESRAEVVEKHHPPHSYKVIRGLKEANAALTRRLKNAEKKVDLNRKKARDQKRGVIVPQGAPIGAAIGAVGGVLASVVTRQLVRTLRKAGKAADEVADTLMTFRRSVLDQLPRAGRALKTLALIASGFVAVKALTEAGITMTTSALLRILGLITGRKLQPTDEHAIQAQSGGIPSWAYGALTLMLLTKSPMRKFNTLAAWGRVGKGVENFVSVTAPLGDWIAQVLENIDKWLRGHSPWGFPNYITELWRPRLEFRKQLHELTVLSVSLRAKLLMSREANVQNVAMARKVLRDVALLRSHPECKGNAAREVDQLLRSVEELARGLQTSVAFNTAKPEPVMVLLVGAPGIGKTAVTPLITAELVKRCASPEQVLACNGDYNREVYNRNASDQYMSGYNMQMITVMDDFAQQRADAMGGGQSDFMWVITNVNAHASQLNMAGLEQKGCTPFVSRAVIATANEKVFKDVEEVIKEPRALYRRITYTFEVTLKEGERLRYADLRRGPDGSLPDLWWFTRANLPSLNGSGPRYSLEEMVNMVAAEMRTRQELFDSVHAEGAAAQEQLRAELRELDEVIRASYQPPPRPPIEPQGAPLPFVAGLPLPLSNWEDQALRTLSSGLVHGHAYDLFSLVGCHRSTDAAALLRRYRDLRRMVHPDHGKPLNLPNIAPGEMEANFIGFVNDMCDFAKRIISDDWSFGKYKRLADQGKAWLFNASGSDVKEVMYSIDEEVANFNAAVTIMALVGTAWLLYAAVRVLAPVFEGIVAGLRAMWRSTFGRPGGRGGKVQPQGALNPDRKRVIEANVVIVERKSHGDGTWVRLGQMLGLRDSFVLVPRHFARCVQMDDEVMLTQLAGESQVMKGRDFALAVQGGTPVRAEDDDLVVADMPHVRRFRDVTKHLLAWQEGEKHWLNNALVLQVVRGTSGLQVNVSSPHRLRLLQVQAVRDIGNVSDVIEQQQDYQFGSCGALLLTGGKSGGYAMGLYVAGGDNRGYYRSVRSHQVLEALDKAGQLIVAQGAPIGGLIEQGLATYPVHVPTRTRLVRTGMEEELGEGDHVPAMLRSTGDIHPMANALAPYGVEPVHLGARDRERLTEAVAEVTTSVLQTSEAIHYGGVLSVDQAIEGVPELGLRAIDATTSPGYPWVQRGRAKAALLERGTKENAELRAAQDALEAKLKTPGPEPAKVIYATFLKDELRSSEKVRDGKTRPIHGAPLELVVLYRRYFGAFEAALKAGRISNGMGVGINPHSDWGTLAAHLGTAGVRTLDSRVFAGDYTAFDASQSIWLFEAYAEIANAWYATKDGVCPEDAVVRRELMRTLDRPYIVVGPKIYRMRRGLPSGHPGTACINSVSNLLLLSVVYKSLGAPGKMLEECHAVVWGDDHVVAPTAEVAKVFNQNTVVAPLARLGFTYTPETKEDRAPDTRTLGEVELLKRRFATTADGAIVAPLRLESILKSVRWAREPNNTSETLEQNCRAALVELAKHEPAVWQEWAPRIHSGCVRLTGVSLPRVHGAQDYWLRQWSSLELPDWMH